MVAGLNLRVNHIELVGGRVDDVPRQLVTNEGLIIETHKAFYIAQEAVRSLGVTEGKTALLNTTQGDKTFSVDHLGWVTPSTNETDDTQVF